MYKIYMKKIYYKNNKNKYQNFKNPLCWLINDIIFQTIKLTYNNYVRFV